MAVAAVTGLRGPSSCRLRISRGAGRPQIYGLDDPPGGIYGLADGFVDVLIASPHLPPWLAHVMRPGSWVGAAATVTGTPRRAGLVTRTSAALMHVPEHKLNRIAKDDPLTWKHGR